jgi:hypothetical protein
VLVQRLARRRDAVVGEELAGGARVLAIDHIGAGQRLEGAQADVAQIADGGRHHIEARRQRRRREAGSRDEKAARLHVPDP